MNDLLQRELHYMQFREICAKFVYKSSLFIRNPSYVVSMDDDTPKQIVSLGISGIGYTDWDQETYSKFLYYFWEDYGMPYQKIYKGDDKVWTLLQDESGTFIELKDSENE